MLGFPAATLTTGSLWLPFIFKKDLQKLQIPQPRKQLVATEFGFLFISELMIHNCQKRNKPENAKTNILGFI